MFKSFISLSVAAAATLVAVAPAEAQQYNFQLSGQDCASFMIDLTTDSEWCGGNLCEFYNIAGTYDGLTTSSDTIRFFLLQPGQRSTPGGFNVSDADGLPIGAYGEQLFTAGTYTINSFVLGSYVLGNHTLVISPGAVPEPATWAMMLFGFAGIAFAMRRKRTAVPAGA